MFIFRKITDMYTSKISGADYASKVNQLRKMGHPCPELAAKELNCFGGKGQSKPANTESIIDTREEITEERQVRNIEHSGSMIYGNDDEIVVSEQPNPRRSVGSNQGSHHSKRSFRDEVFETEKPKSFWAKICCCLPCFKKPENPLLWPHDKSEGGEDIRGLEENLV